MTANVQAKLLDVIAKSWTDPDYKKRLLADPNSVLAEDGIEVPDGTTVKVVDQQPNETYLFLPPRPQGEINVTNVASQTATSASLTGTPNTAPLTGCLAQPAAAIGQPNTAPLTGCLPHTAYLTGCLAQPAAAASGQPNTALLTGCLPHTAYLTGCLPHTALLTGCLPHTALLTGCLPHTAYLTGCLGQSAPPMTIPHTAAGPGGTGGDK